MSEANFDFARSEDKDAACGGEDQSAWPPCIWPRHASRASARAKKVIEAYFANMSSTIRQIRLHRRAAEPKLFRALVQLAERAYGRPFRPSPKAPSCGRSTAPLRNKEGLGHEDALRGGTALTVLLSLHCCYRFDLAPSIASAPRLAPDTTALRLRAGQPAELFPLVQHAGQRTPDARRPAGDLHKPEVLVTVQALRCSATRKCGGLATEFAGNWLDFRRFEEHNGVDGTGPAFTPEMRQAMFRSRCGTLWTLPGGTVRSSTCCMGRTHREPVAGKALWHAGAEGAERMGGRVLDAQTLGRGGLLPMACSSRKTRRVCATVLSSGATGSFADCWAKPFLRRRPRFPSCPRTKRSWAN